VDSHDKVVREKGLSEEAVLAAVRLAAVIHGLAAVLDAERVTASQPVTA
jgi:alkyl hydroperoxide reductase subunit D